MPEQELVIQQRDGKLYALTDPDECLWSVDVIKQAHPDVLTVDDDVATLRLADEARRYRLSEPRDQYGLMVVQATRIRDDGSRS